jgi:flagellin
VDRIANTTEFNTKKLLNGDRKGAVNAKEGSGVVEGTFTKADMRVEYGASIFKKAAYTDVIRIEIKTDGSKLGTGNAVGIATSSITSIFGKYKTSDISCSGSKITISNAAYQKDLTVSSKIGNSVNQQIEIKITGTHFKAGDVITISLNEAVLTASAKTGKDALRLQVGANSGQEVTLGINDMGTKALRISKDGSALKVDKQADAAKAINAYDMAIQKVSAERAKMGAMQNRLEHTIANLDSAAENTQNSESRIRDTDMAAEMVEFSKNNILAQAGQSMLAQANQSNQGVLSLLG